MRLTIYIMLAVFALFAASYYGKPIGAYVERVKAENALKQRQTAIVSTDKRTSNLQHSLIELSAAVPSADQVRIALIHNNISSDGNQILQYDIITVVAPRGKTAGPLTTNLPLGNWSDFLRTLLAHECAVVATKDMVNDAERSRLVAQSIAQILACPITNAKGQLLGAVFADWDTMDAVPPSLDAAEKALRRTAKDAATAIGNP